MHPSTSAFVISVRAVGMCAWSGSTLPAGTGAGVRETSARHLQIPQRRSSGLAASVAADHSSTLLPAALAFGLVDGSAVLGRAPGHAHQPHNLRFPQPEHFHLTANTAGRMASKARVVAGMMATAAPWASASVLERTTVMRPLRSFQCWTLPKVSSAASGRLGPALERTAVKSTDHGSSELR